jgi:anti-sigma B factor antagonist
MDLGLTIDESGLDPVITVSGDLDVMGAARLRDCADGLIAHGHDRLVFDLRGLGFMDSMGLGVLISLLTRGVALVLRAVPRHAAEVLELTGVDEMLTIEP